MAGGSVPANLAPIFQAAGKANNIPPAVLAGIASVETNLGQNLGPSSAGAVGLMQFEPGTARSIGINPMDARQAIFGAAKLLNQYGYQSNPTRAIGAYNGGPGNPQYGYAQQVLSEARRLAPQLQGSSSGLGALDAPGGAQSATGGFNAAGFRQAEDRYLAGSFLKQQGSDPFDSVPGEIKLSDPLLSSGLLTTKTPNPQHYITATGALQNIAGSSLVNVHPNAKGYVNPFPSAVIGRTDQGVDLNMKPGSPIRALGDSKVVRIVPNWYSGQPLILMQLTSGPQAGKYWYAAEQISPTVREGQSVRAGQVIGTYAQSGTGIEAGWGSPNTPHMTLATAPGHGGYTEGQVTPEGASFRSFLGGL
jgi:murein DD-endopeptidase MepM/ murein hydrolase activator NlpD